MTLYCGTHRNQVILLSKGHCSRYSPCLHSDTHTLTALRVKLRQYWMELESSEALKSLVSEAKVSILRRNLSFSIHQAPNNLYKKKSHLCNCLLRYECDLSLHLFAFFCVLQRISSWRYVNRCINRFCMSCAPVSCIFAKL